MVSAIAVPLMLEDRSIGALGIWTYDKRKFGTDDVALLTLFAAQVAPALEPARRVSERESQARAFRALYEVAVAVSQVHQPDVLARVVVDSARDVLEADAATLAWFDDETGTLRVLADNDPYPDQAEYLPGEGAIGLAYQCREGFIVEDYASWPNATPLGKASGVRKVAAVPLMVGDQALGSLAVYGYTSSGMGNRHVQLLSLLGSQVAPVLQGAGLLVSSQHQARVFRALHELAVAASGILDPARVAR